MVWVWWLFSLLLAAVGFHRVTFLFGEFEGVQIVGEDCADDDGVSILG